MEIADLFVVNKADRPGAEKLRQEIEVTLGIRRGNAFRNMPAHHGVQGRAATLGANGRRTMRAGTQPVLLTVRRQGRGRARADRRAGPAPRLARAAAARWTERRRRRLLDRTREVVDRATRRWVWEETRADRAHRRPAGRGRGGAGSAPTMSRPKCWTGSSKASGYDDVEHGSRRRDRAPAGRAGARAGAAAGRGGGVARGGRGAPHPDRCRLHLGLRPGGRAGLHRARPCPDHARRHGPARAISPSPAASIRRCIAAGSGPCGSSPGSARPRTPTSATSSCSSGARPACRWRSTSPR